MFPDVWMYPMILSYTLAFQTSPNKLDSVQPVLSGRELFTVNSNFVSATEFIRVCRSRHAVQATNQKEYGECIQYILNDDALLPRLETATKYNAVLFYPERIPIQVVSARTPPET